MDKAWKRVERAVAKFIGGLRVPVSGRARGDQPDVAHPYLAVEIKYRAKFPGWMWSAMQQARACVRGRQTPVVIFVERGRRLEDAFVLIPLGEFRKRFMPEHVDDELDT